MNESVRNNLIGAVLAVVLLAAVGGAGYMYMKMGPRATAGGAKQTVPGTAGSAATLKPDTLNEGNVHIDVNASINTAYVENEGKVIRLYQLSPDTLARALQLGLKTHDDSVSVVADLHKALYALTQGKDAPTVDWDAFAKQNATIPELFDRLAAINVNEDVKADFKNVAALLRIAGSRHDAQAIVYAHRIMHDLDAWVYNPDSPQPHEDMAKYGAARAYKDAPKSQVATIEAYIAKYRK
jgi:hypothetical protein